MDCYETKALRERLGELKDEMLEMKSSVETEERSFSDEEFSKWDALENEYNETNKKVETAERMARVSTDSKQSDVVVAERSYSGKPKQDVITRSDVGKATKAWLTRNTSQFKDEYAEAAAKCDFSWNSPSININLLGNNEKIKERSQSVGTANKGGHTVSDEIVGGFEEALASYWNWARHCTIHRTSHHGPHRIVTVNDTTTTAAYEAELAAIDNADLTFGEAVFNSYKLTSGIFPVSNELLEDNEIGLGSYIGKALGQRIARTLADEITTGSGSSALTGFDDATTEGVETTSGTAIDQDELIDLYFSVNDVYRQNSIFMMHSLVLAELVKLEDSQGRKLFGPGLNGSPQGTLLGKPVVVNDFLPSALSAGNKVIYFGDFSHVHVRMVRDVSIRESSEKYFLEDAKAFIATMRADSKYVNAGTDPIKHLMMNDGA